MGLLSWWAGVLLREIRERSQPLLSIAAVLVVLFAWWLTTTLQLVQPLFLPTPGATWDAFVTYSTQPYHGHLLFVHVLISLYRVVIALLAAVLIAVPIGLLIGTFRWLDALVEPLLNFFRPLPALAYYTLLVLWLGIGDSSKIAVLFLSGFPAIIINSLAGVRGVRQELAWAARSLGASGSQVFWNVTFPGALPSIFTGIRLAVGFTYTTVVAAEIVAATSGIGWLVLDASHFLRSDVVIMGTIILGVTGLILDSLVVLAKRRFVPWLGRA